MNTIRPNGYRPYSTGDIIGIFLDMNNNVIAFFKNGEQQGLFSVYRVSIECIERIPSVVCLDLLPRHKDINRKIRIVADLFTLGDQLSIRPCANKKYATALSTYV